MRLFLIYGSISLLLLLSYNAFFPSDSVDNHEIIVGAKLGSSASSDDSDDGAIVGAKSGNSDFYVLATFWLPEFCISNEEQDVRLNECDGLSAKRNNNSFILHGLWPNYIAKDTSYPVECIDSPGCNGKGICDFDSTNLTPKHLSNLKYIMYVAYSYIIDHEWTKHGTCSGLTQDQYFALAFKIFSKAPLSDVIENNIGSYVSYEQLIDGYGGKDMVWFGCNEYKDKQYLISINTFWSKDGKRISNMQNGNTCSKDDPIYIRSLSS